MDTSGNALIAGGTADTTISLGGYANYPIPYIALIRHGGTLVTWANYYEYTADYGGAANIVSIRYGADGYGIAVFDIEPLLVLIINSGNGNIVHAI